MPSAPRKTAWCRHDFTLAHEARTTYLDNIGCTGLILTWAFILLFHLLVLATLSAVCFTGIYEKFLLGGICLIFIPLAEFTIVYSIAISAYTHSLLLNALSPNQVIF